MTERDARVTYAMLRFADGTEVMAEFVNGKSVDDALASLRSAATGDPRTLSISDQEVEKVARAIALEFDVDPDVFIGMHGRAKWEEQWHSVARAAILALREGVEEVPYCGIVVVPDD